VSDVRILPKLTHTQTRVLNALRNYVQTHGYPPTVRELADLSGLASTSSVANQLRNLQDAGYIRRGTGKAARRIEIVDPDPVSEEETAQIREIRDQLRELYQPRPLGEVLPEVLAAIRRIQEYQP
jgi:repressor LexA